MSTRDGADVTLEWTIIGHGSARLTWSVGASTVSLETTYVGDGLRSILNAANDLRLGSYSTLAHLLDEPSGYLILFAGAESDVLVQIVVFPYFDHSEQRRWSGGELVWSGRIDVGSLVRAARRMAESVLDRYGVDGKLREWGMPFPINELATLRAAGDDHFA